MAIQDELELVRTKAGGILRPADVIDFARDPSTALHSRFTWDDNEAAEQWRLHQARNIINATVKILPGTNKETRAYVSIVEDRTVGDSYRLIDDVMRDEDCRERLLAQALREAESWRVRYAHLLELRNIFSEIDKAREAADKPAPRNRRRRRKAG